MSIKRNSNLSKAVSAFVGLTTVLALVGGVFATPVAHAADGHYKNPAGTMWTRTLAQGQSGMDVKALQMTLNTNVATLVAISGPGSRGFETMYFGPLTFQAVKKFQEYYRSEILAPIGLSAGTGFVGPMTLRKLNALGNSVTPGTPGTPSTPSTPSTPDGDEGTMTVSLNASPAAGVELSEGDEKVSILGIEIEADQSDIWVERVRLHLGTDKDIFQDVIETLYLYNGSELLASVELDEDSVNEDDSDNLTVTLSGFRLRVAEGDEEVITVKVDAHSSIDSALEGDSFTIRLDTTNPVRGRDEAGIDIYGGSASVTRTFEVEGSDADEASLVVSKDSDSMEEHYVVGTLDENRDAEDVELLRFSIEAENDDLTIEDIGVQLSRSAGPATATSISIYRGSTLVGSESNSLTSGTTTVDMDDFEIEEGETVEFIVKADFEGLANATSTFTTSVYAYGVDANNSEDDSITGSDLSGSATGDSVHLFVAAPIFDLVSATISTEENDTNADTYFARFIFDVTAKGDRIYFYDTGAFALTLHSNNTASSTEVNSGIYSQPSNAVNEGSWFYIPENTTARFEVTYTDTTMTDASTPAQYDVRLTAANWQAGSTTAATTTATHLDDIDESEDFETAKVVMP